MIGLIVPNEPKKIRKLLPDLVECPMGYDVKLLTESGAIGIERKAVPGDLLSSVTDGRLGREIQAMREDTVIQVVLLHGKIRYRKDDKDIVFITKKRYKGREWTRKGIRNLLRTIQYVERCYIEYADNDVGLITVLNELQDYFDSKHLSLKGRPGIHTDWLLPTRQEKVKYFYNGLPGLGPVMAKMLCQQFPNPIDLYQATIEDIMKVPGFGKPTAEKICNFLMGI